MNWDLIKQHAASLSQSPRFVSNIPATDAAICLQAAENTGIEIEIHGEARNWHGYPVPGAVEVRTNRRGDLGEFWDEIKRLREAQGA